MSTIHDNEGRAFGADNPMNSSTIQKKWKDSFIGTSLDSTKWDVIQTGAGMTVSVAGGELTIATGTTINSETILQTKDAFTDPVRVLAGMYISQKIINQAFYIELVSVDKNTLIADGKHGIAWCVSGDDSVTTTNAVYETWNGGMARLRSSATAIINAQTSLNLYELEMFADEMWYHTRAVDSAVGRSASFVRHQQIPDPNALYKMRIRAVNKAVAPASTTNFKFQFVTIVDYSELTVEVTSGRGSASAGQGLPVIVTGTAGVSGTVTANLSSNNSVNLDSVSNLGVSATFTGTIRDAGSVNAFNRFRVMVGHTAGLTPGHLVIEQSDTAGMTVARETHRIPVPSDGYYRTFDFPILARYYRVKFINGVTAQTLNFIQTVQVRSDGGSDYDKSIGFVHTTSALGISAVFTGTTLDLGSNHSIIRHRATAFADQVGTLALQQSRDGSSWRTTAQMSTTANTLAQLEDNIVMRYARVVFTNGATANTVCEVQSALVRG